MQELRPTLWRSCRVLAGPPRLELLRVLFGSREMTVSDLAAQTGISEPLACIHLRALSARGLINPRPEKRWVFYSAVANPLVDHADDLLKSIQECVASGMTNDEIIHMATAFTHQRRIDIAAALSQRKMAPSELSAVTGISRPALHRHLKKLMDRGMVERVEQRFYLLQPTDPLGSRLLELATS